MNRTIASLLLAITLAGCGTPAVDERPLAGARIGGPFTLVDQDGRTVTDRSFAGQWRVMYFGFTFCPDVCPTDVANLARGMKAFAQKAPDKASRTRLIFVSVDPARDTPTQLKAFTRQFLPGMVGLTGDKAAIDATARAYGVAYSIAPGQPKDSYLVDHSRAAYLMDPDNKPVALISQDGSPAEIAAELARWVQ